MVTEEAASAAGAMGSTGLLDRSVDFVAALRRAGLPVSSAEALDAIHALGAVELIDRDALHAAFAATTCKRPAHRATFDMLFDLWWPPVLGEGVAGQADPDGEEALGVPPEDGPPPDRDALREHLRQLLLDGDDAALRRFARDAVSLLGRADAPAGRQAYFSYRVLRALNPQTLLASLLAAMLGDDERGGLGERVARQTINERTSRFESYVEADVRRRLAEQKGAQALEQTVVTPLTDQVDFLRASGTDLAELRRAVFPLARRLATRLTARRRLGRSGRLDFRRTVRASLATGGVPLVTYHRPHKPHKPELVVLCDVSGSVSGFAHFTLMLAYALREQFSKVRAFAFIDTCDEVTEMFRPGDDLSDAVARMAREAHLVTYDGHSDYGHAIEVFAERYPDAITPRTSLLVLGDARANYHATAVGTLRGLVAEARHAYWLNPEPAVYWGTGDSAAGTYGEVMEMVECRNAAQLSEFVERLLPV